MMEQQVLSPKPEKKARLLPPSELSIFCEQVALILSSGVPMYDGMDALYDNYRDTSYEALMGQIRSGVLETGTLYDALSATGVFPPYLLQMVKIGEQTGKLDEVMAQLADYYDRDQKIKKTVQSAIIYPACLVVMIALVILVLVVNVLPIFRQVYQSLGTDVSASSNALMQFGMNAGTVVLIIVGVLMVLALLIGVLMKTPKRQAVINLLSRIIRPVRTLRRSQIARRFAANLSMMMGSGYPLEEALELIEGVMDDPMGREQVGVCRRRMAEGETFPQAVMASGIFDPLHAKMIQMGFATGKTDQVMGKLANLYEEQLDTSITRMVAFIEPTMVVVLSVIIGAILLSVMLPMVSIMSSIL